MVRFFRLARHGFIFAAAKSAVLLAPLLAAALLSQATYGRIEWWLALSLSFSPILIMGANGVVAYGTLGGKLKRHVRTATMFSLLVATSMVLIALTMRLMSAGWNESSYGLIALQIGVICLQTVFSARLKGLSKGAWASVTESSLYVCLLGALFLTLLGLEFIGAYASTLLLMCALLGSGLSYFTPLPTARHWLRYDYNAFLQVGVPFMVGGALMASFMAAPRILLGFLATPEEVGDFALVFRWLSIAIVMHQFFHTVFFRRIFGDVDPVKTERLFIITVTMVAFGAAIVSVFLYMAPQLDLGLPTPSDIKLIVPIAIGVILWATTACLEGSLYRHAASRRQTRAVAIGWLVMLTVAGGWIQIGGALTYGVAHAWAAGLTAIIGTQYVSLRSLGKNFSMLLRFTLLACFTITILINLIT